MQGSRIRSEARCLLALAVAAALAAAPARAQDDAASVGALIRDLGTPDFETAYRAAEQLGRHARHRARVVPALIEAITTRDWNRCAPDVRDAIARALGELGAREAVVPLLEVVKSGTPIEHECVE